MTASLQDSVMQASSTSTVSVTSSSAASSAIDSGDGSMPVVRLYSTTLCHINFNAAATTSSMPLPAGVVEYFKMNKGDTVNVIRNASDGTLYITRMV